LTNDYQAKEAALTVSKALAAELAQTNARLERKVTLLNKQCAGLQSILKSYEEEDTKLAAIPGT
jgi:hypothetical protein